MKIKSYVLAAFLLMSSIVFAGERGGNGDTDVECPLEVIMHDFDEMRSSYANLKCEELKDQVHIVVNEIAIVDRYRAEVLKSYLSELVEDTNRPGRSQYELENVLQYLEEQKELSNQ